MKIAANTIALLVLVSATVVCNAGESEIGDVSYSSLSGCRSWAPYCADGLTAVEESADRSSDRIKVKDVLRILVENIFPHEAKISYLAESLPKATRSATRSQLKIGIAYDGTQLLMRRTTEYTGLSLKSTPDAIDDNKPFALIQYQIHW